MAVVCSKPTYCLSNTGNPNIDDTYNAQPGSYNGNTFYLGQNNSYYIYFSFRGYWCLSFNFEDECLLSGKNPCYTDCPDLCEDYFTAGTCSEPTPPPVDPCDIFDFDAIFDCNVPLTPTPTPTVTTTQSVTPTPSSTDFCPLFVDAVILSYTPTPTITPSVTPTSTIPVIRECGFSGDVTFNTIDTTIDCPYSIEFQDCYNGSKYYSVQNVNRPEGGSLEQFMVYQATVDGFINRCISYVGVNVNIIGNNTITLTSDLLGYSNVGACILCLGISPTPTPTLSQTPTPTPTMTTNRIVPVTPSPTQSRIINYYLYRNCANTNQYICWAGVPFGPTSSWVIGRAFETTSSDNYYPNTCWSLYSIGTSCGNMGVPSYQITSYNSNPFTSLVNSVLLDCTRCSVGGTGGTGTGGTGTGGTGTGGTGTGGTGTGGTGTGGTGTGGTGGVSGGSNSATNVGGVGLTGGPCCCYTAKTQTVGSSGSISFIPCGVSQYVGNPYVLILPSNGEIKTFCSTSISSSGNANYGQNQPSNCVSCRDTQISVSSPRNCLPPKQCTCKTFSVPSNSPNAITFNHKPCNGEQTSLTLQPGQSQSLCIDLSATLTAYVAGNNQNDLSSIYIQDCSCSSNPCIQPNQVTADAIVLSHCFTGLQCKCRRFSVPSTSSSGVSFQFRPCGESSNLSLSLQPGQSSNQCVDLSVTIIANILGTSSQTANSATANQYLSNCTCNSTSVCLTPGNAPSNAFIQPNC